MAPARDLFLFGMASIYVFAFTSLYTQIPGLYGPSGLLPVDKALPSGSKQAPWYRQLMSFPSLVLFHEAVQLPPHRVMELCSLVGALLALFMIAFRAMRCSLMFVFLWALYLSVYKVGQTFMWFQWDILLLEAGFLAILVAPFNLTWKKPGVSCHTNVIMWLVKWLLFRLMFASGVVKLASHCPTWWELTALNYHYESQCIPTPLAWYAHQLPEWLQKLSVVGTYFIEIVVPLMFFLPLRSVRIFSFLSQVLLQLAIIATGNYNFFNLLAITLSFSLLDSESSNNAKSSTRRSLLHRLFNRVFGGVGWFVCGTVKTLLFLTVVGYLIALTVYFFNIRVDSKSWTLTSNVAFSKEEFTYAVEVLTPLAAIVAALSLVWEIIKAALSCLWQQGLRNKVWSLLQTVLVMGIVVPLFAVTMVSHGAVDRKFAATIPGDVSSLESTLDTFAITSSYGLFRRMTGVDGRLELIIEGSDDEKKDQWKEYDFLYKPGSTNGTPSFVAPHQPRLDWQMWFAALGSYQRNPWLVHLVYRLLIGQKEVLKLMADPPFAKPPRFIRARLYHYHFTPFNPERSVFNQTKQWWRRELKQEYLFSLSWDNQGLQDYLHKQNFLPELNHTYPPTNLASLLSYVRQLTDQHRPPWILWGTFTTGVLLALTMALLFPDRKIVPQQPRAPLPTEGTSKTTPGLGGRARRRSGKRKEK